MRQSATKPARRRPIVSGSALKAFSANICCPSGANRDTAWFSIIDGEWPLLNAAFEAWLSPENFVPVTARRSASLEDIRAETGSRRLHEYPGKAKNARRRLPRPSFWSLYGIGFFVLPKIMLWLGTFSPWLAAAFGARVRACLLPDLLAARPLPAWPRALRLLNPAAMPQAGRRRAPATQQCAGNFDAVADAHGR